MIERSAGLQQIIYGHSIALRPAVEKISREASSVNSDGSHEGETPPLLCCEDNDNAFFE